MIKRTWMILVSALALAMLVSACGSSQLAEELTPVPTLAPGETPALVDALGQALAEEPAGEDGGEGEGEGGEDALVAAREELFTQTCAGCHGAGAPPGGGLLLSDAATAHANMVNVAPGPMTLECAGREPYIVPNDADGSLLIVKLEGGPELCGSRMPLGPPPLEQAEIDLIRAWINAGAPNN